jgi:hypothetical protein
LRFFTWKSLERLTRREGFTVVRHRPVGLPIEVFDRGGGAGKLSYRAKRAVSALDRSLVKVRPNLFAYQYVLELAPAAELPAADELAAPDR